jgi:adenylosuccinate synthase
VRYANVVNGFDTLAITKLDVLDDLPEIPVCTGYRVGNEVLDSLPGDLSILESCEPVYEVLPGWKTRTAGTRSFGALPTAAKRYLDRLSELCGVQVGIVSTSPDRDDTILRSTSPAAGWFA